MSPGFTTKQTKSIGESAMIIFITLIWLDCLKHLFERGKGSTISFQIFATIQLWKRGGGGCSLKKYRKWLFSAPELKAQVHYCDNASSVRPSLTFHIFYFSSETTEQNSTKLDRKQDLNVLYQVCVFRADRKK